MSASANGQERPLHQEERVIIADEEQQDIGENEFDIINDLAETEEEEEDDDDNDVDESSDDDDDEQNRREEQQDIYENIEINHFAEEEEEEDFSEKCNQVMQNRCSLFLERHPLNDDMATQVGRALNGNTSVKRVSIRLNNEMTVLGAQALAIGIAGSRLKYIEISVSLWYGGVILVEAMNALYHGIQRCPTIRRLVLDGVMGEGQGRAFSSLLQGLPNLRELQIAKARSLSIEDVELLSDGLRQSSQLTSLHLNNCNLQDEHLWKLSPILGRHPSLEYLSLRVNAFGDEGIAAFVEHWQQHPQSVINRLFMGSNRIGPNGAQCLIKAVAQQSRIRELYLQYTHMIGYEGLKLIGEELPEIKLEVLHLERAADWMEHNDVSCDAAVLQETKRMEAAEALLNGMRNNYYLDRLEVDGNNLPTHVIQELKFYTEANRHHRRDVRMQQTTLPIAVWSHFLSQPWQTNSSIFLFLRDLHVLMSLRGGATA